MRRAFGSVSPSTVIEDASELYFDHKIDAESLSNSNRVWSQFNADETRSILLPDKARQEFYDDMAEVEAEIGRDREVYHNTLRLNLEHFEAHQEVYVEQAAALASADGVEIKPRIIDHLPGNLGLSFTSDIETGDAEHMDLMF